MAVASYLNCEIAWPRIKRASYARQRIQAPYQYLSIVIT
jgi:hypothetical protein